MSLRCKLDLIGGDLDHPERIVLRNPTCRASCEIRVHGAHVTSYMVDGRELLYVSPDASFSRGSKIRGGIPVCWPQFGNFGPIQAQHGFVRTADTFSLVDSRVDDDTQQVSITLRMENTPPGFEEEFPHPFVLEVTVSLVKNVLVEEIAVTNTGEDSLSFTAALHTYYAFADSTNVELSGLHGLAYLDKLRSMEEFVEDRAVVPFSEDSVPVDRCYLGKGQTYPLTLSVARTPLVSIEKEGFGDCVVWNPALAGSQRIGDLPDEDWRKFVCVEIAQIVDPVKLDAGERWAGKMKIRLVPDDE